jgi:hypothetical protein
MIGCINPSRVFTDACAAASEDTAASNSSCASLTRFCAAIVVSIALANDALIASNTEDSASTSERNAVTSFGRGTLFDFSFGFSCSFIMGGDPASGERTRTKASWLGRNSVELS